MQGEDEPAEMLRDSSSPAWGQHQNLQGSSGGPQQTPGCPGDRGTVGYTKARRGVCIFIPDAVNLLPLMAKGIQQMRSLQGPQVGRMWVLQASLTCHHKCPRKGEDEKVSCQTGTRRGSRAKECR